MEVAARTTGAENKEKLYSRIGYDLFKKRKRKKWKKSETMWKPVLEGERERNGGKEKYKNRYLNTKDRGITETAATETETVEAAKGGRVSDTELFFRALR
ncbi:hypothetical protein RUM44_002290 [Polyplax serrata]|uniref:Uncharacterized protein n=1 Tax=Polyplax serrata TaxID=468196 RepID=A0ABR1AP00_POLSC